MTQNTDADAVPPVRRTRANPPAASVRARGTRVALIDAGRKLFSQRPFDAVSIDDIVAAAAVAKGSFYNHFLDKDALLQEIVTDIRDGIESVVASVNADEADPARRVVRAICVYGAYVLDEPQCGAILIRNDRRGQLLSWESMNKGVVADVTDGLASGRFLVPAVETGTLYVMGVAYGILIRFISEGDVPNAVATAQQMTMMLLRGFGLPHADAEMISAQAVDEIIRRRILKT